MYLRLSLLYAVSVSSVLTELAAEQPHVYEIITIKNEQPTWLLFGFTAAMLAC